MLLTASSRVTPPAGIRCSAQLDGAAGLAPPLTHHQANLCRLPCDAQRPSREKPPVGTMLEAARTKGGAAAAAAARAAALADTAGEHGAETGCPSIPGRVITATRAAWPLHEADEGHWWSAAASTPALTPRQRAEASLRTTTKSRSGDSVGESRSAAARASEKLKRVSLASSAAKGLPTVVFSDMVASRRMCAPPGVGAGFTVRGTCSW